MGLTNHATSPRPAVHRAISHARLLAYSLPSLVTSVALLPMVLFVPAFYADELGVPLFAVGVAIAASRLLDVVTDPLIGTFSDRWSTRWGRRKPWILMGTPLFGVALWMIFVPTGQVDALYLLVWSSVLYLGYTMMDLPHKAWGAELSIDYDERSRIAGWREAMSTTGQVAMLAFLAVFAERGLVEDAGQLRGVATAVVIALPVLVALALLLVPEGRPRDFEPSRRKVWEGVALVARNPAFGRMVGCVVLFVGGIAMQGTLHRLVLADILGGEDSFAWMLLLENLATLAGVPLWLAISKRIGKHRALVAAALWIAALSLPLSLLRTGDTLTLLILIPIRGSSFASILFLANSIAADVIDVDTLATGEQRSGLFFAVWGMATKLALALGVLAATALPAALGYDPSAAWIAPAVQARVMLLYGVLPAVLMASGSLLLWNFPITRDSQTRVNAEIEARLAALGDR